MRPILAPKALVVVVVALLASGARAATLQYEFDFTPTGSVDVRTENGACGQRVPSDARRDQLLAGPVYVPQFDPARGELDSVSVDLKYYANLGGAFSHCFSTDRNLVLTLHSDLTAWRRDTPGTPPGLLSVAVNHVTDNLLVEPGGFASTYILPLLTDSAVITSSLGLQPYVGTGSIPFIATGRESVAAYIGGGGQRILVSHLFNTTATLGVTYHYTPSNPACSDTFDNDGDGLIDLEDPGCAEPSDLDEHSLVLPCDDAADNDADGLADFQLAGGDPGCSSPSWATESPQCQDGLDNDSKAGIDFDGGDSLDINPRDGFIDTAFNPAMPPVGDPDPQCLGKAFKNNEACGLGAELAVALPLLGALRRRGGRSSRR